MSTVKKPRAVPSAEFDGRPLAPSRPGTVLVLDDEPLMLSACERILRNAGHRVIPVDNAPGALQVVGEEAVDVVLADVRMPGMTGLEFLPILKHRDPELEVIMMTGYATLPEAVQAIKSGAFDFLAKPFEDIEKVQQVVSQALARHRMHRAQELPGPALAGIVGQSPVMQDLFRLIERVAPTQSPVLIQGESGTGKELVARAVHQLSSRRHRAFVVVNCAAIEILFESEFFGHEKGAFTGAIQQHVGLFESADQGTIFLDEIGDISPYSQVKLLRVIEVGEVKRVGSNRTAKINARVIAASNHDLETAVRQGAFRQDLFYRLHVVPIQVPPLRERAGDIPLLARHFLALAAAKFGKPVTRILPEALACLQAYSWPGNVRELENTIERAVILAAEVTIRLQDLPVEIALAESSILLHPNPEAPLLVLPYVQAKERALAFFHQRYLSGLLLKTSGNIARAARLSHLDRSNFRRLLKRWQAH